MMDYYSEFPGPTKDQAIKDFKQSLKPVLLREANVPPQFVDKINKIIDESIDEGVDKAHENYSLTGWRVFGEKECIQAIRNIYAQKLKEFKSKQKRENDNKLALAKSAPDIYHHIMPFRAGKKRKTKRKYTFKKRKGTKRVIKKKRHSRRNQ
tara:strand:- start:3 stop:458 length:456 start_codon:yes stop_codon:yes gene_type:complete